MHTSTALELIRLTDQPTYCHWCHGPATLTLYAITDTNTLRVHGHQERTTCPDCG